MGTAVTLTKEVPPGVLTADRTPTLVWAPAKQNSSKGGSCWGQEDNGHSQGPYQSPQLQKTYKLCAWDSAALTLAQQPTSFQPLCPAAPFPISYLFVLVQIAVVRYQCRQHRDHSQVQIGS